MRLFALIPWLATSVGCVIVVKDTATTPGETGPSTNETGAPTETGDTNTGDPDGDGDGFPASEDCDDGNPSVYPGAPPVCGVSDANCDLADDGQIHVPSAAPTLEEALATAPPGGRICIESGTHLTNAVAGKGVDVTIDAVEPGAAILDGAGGRALTLTEDAVVRVEDLVLTGGGVMAEEADLSLTRVSWSALECIGSNGSCDGAAVWTAETTLTMTDVTINGANVVGAKLGGLLHLDDGDLFIDGLTVEGGTIASDSGTLQGGVLWTTSAALTASFVRVAGVAVDGPGVNGGAAYLFATDATLSHWVVAGTMATAEDEVNGTAISMSASSSAVAIAHSTFTGNSAAANTCRGGGLYGVTVAVTVNDVIFSDHIADCSVISGTAIYSTGDDPVVTYSDFWNNVGAEEFDGFPDPLGAGGNLAVEPGFVDVATWDLHLGAKSPLVDAGDPAILDDDGTASDIGAYGGPGGSSW
jgi:hypothetical protein